MKVSPHRAIFDRPRRRGNPVIGAQVGAPPPVACTPTLSIAGSLLDATHLSGIAQIDKSGDVVYAVNNGVVDYLSSVDVTDTASPALLDAFPSWPLGNSARCLIDGNYLYVGRDNGISVVDIATHRDVPVAGVTSGTFDVELNGQPWGMVIDGNYLYVTVWASQGRLVILDISTPLAPVIVGSVSGGSNMNNPRDIVKVGNYVYVAASGTSRLYVVDVTTPTAPSIAATLLNSAPQLNNVSGMAAAGNYLYVSRNQGLTVIDISTPTSPTFTGTVTQATASSTVALVKDGNYAYVTSREPGVLRVFSYDVSVPTAPTLAGAFNLTALGDAAPDHIAKNGNYLYVTIPTQDKIRIIDVSNPLAMTDAGSFASTAAIDVGRGMALSGSSLYVAGHQLASKLDVSTATSPSVLWTTYGDWLEGPLDVVTVGGYAFVMATVGGRITTFDVSDPSDIQPVASLQHSHLTVGAKMVTDGTHLYVISNSATNRLSIYDASNPLAVSFSGSVTDATALGGPQDVKVQGSYVYVAAITAGRLGIVNVSNPASPTVAGSVSHANLAAATAVAVNGSYAYVTALNLNRLTVVDVSNPASPSVVGSIQDNVLLPRGFAAVYDNDTVYVCCQVANRVTAVDVSSPTSPTIVTSLPSNTYLNRLQGTPVKDGDILYVPATLGNNLAVLEADCITGAFPTVTVNQNVGQADPTSTPSIVFDIVFSEAVSVFNASHISFAGSTAGGAPAGVVTGTGPSYTFTVTGGMTTSGTIVPSVPIGAVVSASTGRPNAASTSTDNVVNWVNPFLLVGSVTDVTQLNNPEGLASVGDLLVVCVTGDATDEVSTMDASTPSAPTVIGNIANANLSPSNIAVIDATHAIVTSGAQLGRIQVINFATPTAPTIQGSAQDSANFFNNQLGVAVIGTNAFISGQGKLGTVDISNPAAPAFTNVASDATNYAGSLGYRPMVAAGSHLYMIATNQLTVVDVSAPNSPTVVGTLSRPSDIGSGPVSIDVAGGICVIVSTSTGRLTVIDVSTPSAPSFLGMTTIGTSLATTGRGCVIVDDYVIVCKQTTMQAIDISNPANPVILGFIANSGTPTYITRFGSDMVAISEASGDRVTIYQIITI